MTPELTLTTAEARHLQWCAGRGYFPDDFAAHVIQHLSDWDDARPHVVPIPEHLIHSLVLMRVDCPDDYLTCVAPDLRDRLTALETLVD